MATRKSGPGSKKKRPVKNVTTKPGPKSKELIDIGRKVYTKNYKPREVIIDHGKGAKVWDKDGKEYIDFAAGIAVSSLGHSNPRLLKAFHAQGDKLWHTSNVFFNEPAVRLAQELCKTSKFAKRVFFCSSGGEANECGIKVARKYAANKGKSPEERKIITFKGSFHGRTLATVTATAQPKYHEGFEPMPEGFVYCDFNDKKAFDKLMGPDICAVMTEVVQGEGGIRPMEPGMLKHIQDACHKHDALLFLDQVQCGMGRTGHLFSHFAEKGVKPDIVSLAKGLGGGMPIGASLLGEKVKDVLQMGSHGSTYGGNPVATAVALEVLKQLQTKRVQQNVEARSEQIVEGLKKLNKTYGIFKEIRGRGLMIGAELKKPYHGKAANLSERARQQRLLLLVAGPNVMRFVPPLTITSTEVKSGLKRLEFAIQSFMLKQK